MNSTGQPCQVAILAGGLGTRLAERTGGLPKPMAPICGKPVIEHLFALCKRHGFVDIALLVHHRYEAIRAYFGDGSALGLHLSYVVEEQARGTAGALYDALPLMAKRFLVLYGDTYADVDLRRIWDWHSKEAAGATLFLHPNDHPADSDLVALSENQDVEAIYPYPRPVGEDHANLVNAALYVCEKNVIATAQLAPGRSDLAKDLIPGLIRAGVRVKGYVSPEYIKDMGTPERLDKVEAQVTAGVADRLSTRQPRQAVFIDRDGTVNHEAGHLNAPDALTLLPGVADAIRLLNRAGYLAVGITNQPVLARGEVDNAGMKRIHARLDRLLGEGGAYLDRMYLCPHHPDQGFPGEVVALKVACACRKPATGLIDRAVGDMNIARQHSWVIGDSTADILAGNRAGLRTILVRTGNGGADGKYECAADFVMDDLLAAVMFILSSTNAGEAA